jgi:hypothetical protein
VPVWPCVGTRQYPPRCLALVAVIGAGLLVALWPMAAFGALWVRIGVEPARPTAGHGARVAVQTLLVEGASCLDDPNARVTPTVAYTRGDTGGAFLDRMELQALGTATDPPVKVQVTRRADDPTVWEAPRYFRLRGSGAFGCPLQRGQEHRGRARVRRRWLWLCPEGWQAQTSGQLCSQERAASLIPRWWWGSVGC